MLVCSFFFWIKVFSLITVVVPSEINGSCLSVLSLDPLYTPSPNMSVNEFTKEEGVAIKEFRNRLSDVLPADKRHEYGSRNDTLIRWIRARELDLNKAEDMYRHSLEWRINNGIDFLLDSSIDLDMEKKFPYFVDGVDKIGRPVVSIHYGEWDVRSFIEEAGGIERFTHYCNELLERAYHEIKLTTLKIATRKREQGEEDEESDCVQFVIVVNMGGYSYRQLANMKAVQTIIKFASVYEAHYPETLAKCVVINAPTIFSILFGLIKPFMTPRTLEKIQVFGSKKRQWQPVLLDLMEPHQIRERFGGTKVEA